MATAECEMETDDCEKKNVTMCHSQYTAIFLFLALSALIFLLRNINILELSFRCKINSAMVPNGSSLLHHNHSHCNYWSQRVSPEEALEERSLFDSIAWPEPPHLSTPPLLKQTSDPAHSRFTILPAEGGREWHVGDQLEAVIQMFDLQGRPKHYGGDFIIARLHNKKLVAGVAGQVVDHLDGSYSVFFPLLWEGSAQVEVTLVHPSEAVAVLSRIIWENPDRHFYQSIFRSGSVSETTVCNICLLPVQIPICNFTDPYTGEPWFCYKPTRLSCDTRVSHMRGYYQKNNVTKEEEQLFRGGVNIKVHIPASGSDSVNVLPEKKECEMEPDHCKKKKVTMSNSTCVIILIFLAVSGVIFRLCNINSLKLRSRPKIHSYIVLNGSSLLHHKHSYCNYWNQEVSPEEALEERSLLDSIAWPEPPHFSTPPLLTQTSDPAHSRFTILPAGGGREWHVGDQLEAVIQMFDLQGRPKHYGGDFIIARLHNKKLVAGVVGQVVDHLNGSYSIFFPLLWEGSAHVEVTLVHPSEAVTVLSRLLKERPDRVRFQSQFRSGSMSETTYCNICLPPIQLPICNYTDLYTGELWYCYKPKRLSCDKRITHVRADSQKDIVTKEETLLFQKVKVHIPASGNGSINVLPKKKDQPEVKSSSVKPGPSGYYYQDVWRNLGGITVRQFNNASAISECLKDKLVYTYGDSTARQWFEYLNAALPELKEINLHGPKKMGPYLAVDISRNIMLTYRCHGPPINYNNVPTSELRYIANELDSLVGGTNTVVVLSVWAHFTPFPVEVYIIRLQIIRRAVIRLQRRAPGTLVVIRTGNPRALSFKALDLILNYSDWYSFQHLKVLRAMFKGLNVHLVDAWEMTLVHHLPHDLHPAPPVVKNMINVLLSYIC